MDLEQSLGLYFSMTEVETYYRQGFSLAAITSILYLFHGVTGIRYMELRKKIFTECQRIDSEDKKKA